MASGASRPLVVLHIIAPADFGGLEAVVQALAIGSRGSAVTSHVATVVAAPEHPFLGPLRNAGVDVEPIVVSTRGYRAERAAVRQTCRRLKPDIVHTHGYRPDVLDAPVARALGIPVVTTVHGFTGGDWKNRVYEWLQRRAYRRFDAVVAVSQSMAHVLVARGVPPGRVRVIHNAWRPAAPPLDRAGALATLGESREVLGARIGWVGRLSREKGPDVFLEGLARLQGRPWTACILGDGPERMSLQERASALGIAERIHWHGVVDRAASLFSAFDVFVISSRTEGVPIVLFEAMSVETPIVATTVGGIPEVVTPREARLVPSEDPAALATALAAVLDDRASAQTRAQAAARRLKDDFGFAAWLQRYEALYRSLLSGSAAGMGV